MPTVEATILETAAAWEQDGSAAGEVRDILGAVDETFLAHLLLVFQDVSTGYLLLETVAEDRTYTTWKAVVDKRLAEVGTGGLSLVSDRAKALIQLAAHGLACLSMPDFFPCIHALVKSSSLAMGQRWRHAQQERMKAQEALARRPGPPHMDQPAFEAKALVEARQVEVMRWEEAHHISRGHLETLSLALHPFSIADSTPHTSAEVESQLQATVAASEA